MPSIALSGRRVDSAVDSLLATVDYLIVINTYIESANFMAGNALLAQLPSLKLPLYPVAESESRSVEPIDLHRPG